MKVALITRSTLYSVPGGDTIQVVETAKQINAHGITAEIKLTNELSDYHEYNLLHFFNITRPADIHHHIKKSKKPFVVSTNFVDYSNYDKHHRKGFSGLIFKMLSSDKIEYAKTILRYILRKDKLPSIAYIRKGQRKCITEIITQSKLLLPNSHSEYEAIAKTYHLNPKYTAIPNGINTEIFVTDNSIEKDPTMVICAARIEGIKNQLNLIKALNNTHYQLFIIGKPAPNQFSYYHKCKRLAAKNISFIDYLPQHELIQYYQKAKVHILPSWFETTGLSSLEAATMGCNVVITDKGYTREYFGEDAIYCDPESPKSIFEGVVSASKLPYNENLKKRILSDYTWEQASLQTIKAYNLILKN
ncbi:MAG TPA: glycosyltransferase family 4 protein [Puia sp.]|nr:glycosyltransferase family 4 protein [Puia sp.]